MDISTRTIWQQAAGDNNRNYSDICLKWDVILNGPGWAGAWPGCKEELADDGVSARKQTDLRRFAEVMKEGDLVVLHVGTRNVLGIGEVVGPYEWHDECGDVDGWDLEHVRRVRWLWKHDGSPKEFSTYDLKPGDTTQTLSDGVVTQWISSLEIPADALIRPLAEIPVPDTPCDITVDRISDFLFDHGVASGSITHLLNEIGELTRIAKWYQSNVPSEHETVAYLVVPLLRALGWTPQRMAVEWNNIDVALFNRLPRSSDSLRVVVEAKKMKSSCLTAKHQAECYADGRSDCHRLIVTDGLRYGVYVRDASNEFTLYAYLNLTRFRSHYPIYQCRGAEDALLAMAPEWNDLLRGSERVAEEVGEG